MRKLASIQRIWKIEPIEGADRIELAHVLGWQCVVNKGQFREMDLAVYFEVDSFLPIAPEFEFLRASSYRKTDIMGEGFRLRTMKFRGQISQGLLLPISTFPLIPKDAEPGLDVTELLGVKKWEIEERITTDGTMIGPLPYDIPHTDETRVQAEPGLIRAFAGMEYYISTKMDGSSHSVGIEEIDYDLPSKYPTVEALLERADGNYPKGGKKEGIVIRPTEPVYCELINAALSMKAVSNKYLLKNE